MSRTLLLLFLFTLALLPTPSQPAQLLTQAKQNECIKNLVYEFISGSTCEKLSQGTKMQLAYRMMNCLLVQMGKDEMQCRDVRDCDLRGDAWNTFTSFFTHIDNLCHFYWDVSKAERTEQMIDALLTSASKTAQTLQKNTQNTQQILQLQSHLRLQLLQSLTTQTQLHEILTKTSLQFSTLTSHISSSLTKLHTQIDQHYTLITRILSAVDQVAGHLDALRVYLVAEVRSVQGVMFFGGLMLAVVGGCFVSERVRVRRSQCFVVVCGQFLVEFFFGERVNATVGVQPMRCVSIVVIFVLIASAKSGKNQVEMTISTHLSSERMSRIMEKAVRRQMLELKLQRQTQNAAP